MKVIIAGSRDIVLSVQEISNIVTESGFMPTHIVSGVCRGIDLCGEAYAKYFNLPILQFPPEYDKYGPKMAPLIRNSRMAVFGDVLIAIPGAGTGTYDMIKKMKARNKPIFIWKVK